VTVFPHLGLHHGKDALSILKSVMLSPTATHFERGWPCF
jgi:hypothetical protein